MEYNNHTFLQLIVCSTALVINCSIAQFCNVAKSNAMRSSKISLKSIKFKFWFSDRLYTVHHLQSYLFTTNPIEISLCYRPYVLGLSILLGTTTQLGSAARNLWPPAIDSLRSSFASGNSRAFGARYSRFVLVLSIEPSL